MCRIPWWGSAEGLAIPRAEAGGRVVRQATEELPELRGIGEPEPPRDVRDGRSPVCQESLGFERDPFVDEALGGLSDPALAVSRQRPRRAPKDGRVGGDLVRPGEGPFEGSSECMHQLGVRGQLGAHVEGLADGLHEPSE